MVDIPLEWGLGRLEPEKQGGRNRCTEDAGTGLGEEESEWLAGSLALRSWWACSRTRWRLAAGSTRPGRVAWGRVQDGERREEPKSWRRWPCSIDGRTSLATYPCWPSWESSQGHGRCWTLLLSHHLM